MSVIMNGCDTAAGAMEALTVSKDGVRVYDVGQAATANLSQAQPRCLHFRTCPGGCSTWLSKEVTSLCCARPTPHT